MAAKPTILIVEDEADIRELVRYHLEQEGYAVEEADSGEKGLERAAATRPALDPAGDRGRPLHVGHLDPQASIQDVNVRRSCHPAYPPPQVSIIWLERLLTATGV